MYIYEVSADSKGVIHRAICLRKYARIGTREGDA